MSDAGELRNDGERCAIHFERLYDATPDELWAALTDPEQVRGWLAHTSRFRLEPEGEVFIDFGGGDEGGQVHGRIVELDPPRVVAYTWTFPGEPESIVRFEVVPRAAGCLLVLDHRRLGRASGLGYSAGWHAHLDDLALHLTGGRGDWDARFRELLPVYEPRAAELGWIEPESSPVRAALYRGDREAAEAAATGDLDVFDAAALGRVERLGKLIALDPGVVASFSNDGFTPLHLACFSGGPEAARLLIEAGGPLEELARSPFARVRPLGTAAFSRSLDGARLLLDAGADPNGAGEGGFRPLHAAAQNGDEELVRLLLERGADPTLAADDGRTAAELAREAGHGPVVELLVAVAR